MFNNAILLAVKKSLINVGTKIYNNFPLETKSVDNYNVFKRKVKNYLLHSAFYSLQEFLSNAD
jgi:hypothetical protein